MPAAQPQTGKTAITIEDIYNTLMAEIEPDLTTHMLPVLDEMYAEESANDRRERLEGYAKSFEEFTVKFEEAMGVWKGEIKKWKTNLLGIMKKGNKEKDTKALSDIERSIDTL